MQAQMPPLELLNHTVDWALWKSKK